MPGKKTEGEFTGLSLKQDSKLLELNQATVAEDCVIIGGSIQMRPGKQRLARWNGEPLVVLGMFSYFPLNINQRSTLIVANDRIFASVI